jgi:hypothetical protein
MPADAEAETTEQFDSQELARLLRARPNLQAEPALAPINGVRIGRLVGFGEDGAIPLVTYMGQESCVALGARATLDLHAAHFDRDLVLMFEDGDPLRPIVVGCLHDHQSMKHPGVNGEIEVDANGRRLVVSAKDQIVLRCGKASITLTKEGKVILQGAYVSSESSGALRIKGGSVQIN